MVRCGCLTVKGVQCSNSARTGSRFCGIKRHQNCPEVGSPSKGSPSKGSPSKGLIPFGSNFIVKYYEPTTKDKKFLKLYNGLISSYKEALHEMNNIYPTLEVRTLKDMMKRHLKLISEYAMIDDGYFVSFSRAIKPLREEAYQTMKDICLDLYKLIWKYLEIHEDTEIRIKSAAKQR